MGIVLQRTGGDVADVTADIYVPAGIQIFEFGYQFCHFFLHSEALAEEARAKSNKVVFALCINTICDAPPQIVV